jgi:hypothetical protein
MTPHRRYAASFMFAAILSTSAIAESPSQANVMIWTQSAVTRLTLEQQINHKWRKITPKYIQPGHDVNRKDVWLVRLVDPTAGMTTEQNLYLILTATGELIEFSTHLPSHYLINKN